MMSLNVPKLNNIITCFSFWRAMLQQECLSQYHERKLDGPARCGPPGAPLIMGPGEWKDPYG